MKKILLFLLAGMLGCGLAGAQNTRVLGKVLLEGSSIYVTGIDVSIVKGDYSDGVKTDYGEDYYDLLQCPYAYEFQVPEAGTYELTYSYGNYETQKQQITIEAGVELFIAPPVTLRSRPSRYTFGGQLRYITSDGETRTVADARILCYKDEQGTETLAETVTDEEGNWQVEVSAKAGDRVYFDALHSNIVIPRRISATANNPSGLNNVDIPCEEKTLALLGMETCKLRQVGAADAPLVEVRWTWPQELLDNYRRKEGEGVYRITRVQIFRDLGGDAGWSEVGVLDVDEYELPGTCFVDGQKDPYRLLSGRTYQYRLDITYRHPKIGVVRMEDLSRLTITLEAEVPHYDSVILELEADRPEWGTVVGAGKYEKNDQVVIRAQAKEGYVFSAWKKGGETVSATAKHTLVIAENMKLTAVFEEKDPVYDSADLTLEVKEAGWGTVEGQGRYAKGGTVKIKATPAEGYLFKEWRQGSVFLSSKAEYEFILDSTCTLTAVFGRDIAQLGMTDCKVKQIGTRVNRISWRWPQDFQDGYVDEEGEGTYEVFRINVFRLEQGDPSYTEIGIVRTEAGMLPTTFFVDSGSAYPLMVGKTYTYQLEVVYAKPLQQSVFIKDEARLTVKMVVNPVVVPDTVILDLRVNDAAMGTVQGGGEYAEGQEVTIKATANEGYAFVAWMNRKDTVSTEAEYKFVLEADLRLTALFMRSESSANEVCGQAAWHVYTEGRTLVLRGDAACRYDIYNVSGVLVKCVPAAHECRIAVDNSGLYIVRRMSSTGTSVKKVMVR